ncbi:dUTP diphosphatase [Corynebacterium freneyi]|uniref:dUTP diphosphatase n=1 Tax=Corynebacterium freneyi TaxID=134034 RepID=A0ABS4U9V5_9CORY|nr:dUTP diphosphatase [Corynebacterium freneyi]MBP2333313.1 dUTP pyrophosphatase [Corynebacterium freneyi]QXA52635.1 dUTP diphosphatase [Corynebacterium freneyi]WJZ04583.1 Deoxyuridine 5'-triphosphate nucleotidohydrolase [Corynebacterium freneyi]
MTLPYQGTKPTRAHHDDAGLDLTSAETLVIPSGQRRTVRLGTAVAIPTGHVGLLCPRSGLAAKHGITTLTVPGIIDSGYRGELRIVLFNTDPAPYQVRRGDRIAQLVIVPFTHLAPVAQPLDTADRGPQGFGSTGT